MGVPGRRERVVGAVLVLLVVWERGSGEKWDYEHPEVWQDRCHGVTQSPINFTYVTDFNPPRFIFKNYGLVNISLKNNGHALQVVLELSSDHRPMVSGGWLGGNYVLDSFHFHWGSRPGQGSEHLLMGCAFSGEMHFVHYKEEYGSVQEALEHPDGLAVLGVWLLESQGDPAVISDLLATRADDYFSGGGASEEPCHYTAEEHAAGAYYWLTNLAPSSATYQDAHAHVYLRQLLPFDVSTYYRYRGSLTTPPCTENVKWTVFQDAVVLPRPLLQGLRTLTTPIPPGQPSEDQESEQPHSLSDNFRPTQPLENRTVYFSGDPVSRLTTCTAPPASRRSCLQFPEVVATAARQAHGRCYPSSPLDLRLRDAEVVVSPNLVWKRVENCHAVSITSDGQAIRVRYSTRAPQWDLSGSDLPQRYYLGEMVLRPASAHLLGGLNFPLEIQLIHYNEKYGTLKEALTHPDGVVVVSKLFQKPLAARRDSWGSRRLSGHNRNLHFLLTALADHRPPTVGAAQELVVERPPNVRQLMGSTSTYYEYLGFVPDASCDVPATWLVIRKSGKVSEGQVELLRRLLTLGAHSASSAAHTASHAPGEPLSLLLRVTDHHVANEYRTLLNGRKGRY